MKHSVSITFFFVQFFSGISLASSLSFNKWYAKDGVLYDVTQTSDSRPVLLSISSAGASGMTISYESTLSCEDRQKSKPLKIDTKLVPFSLACITAGSYYIVTYTVTDARTIKYVLDKLRSDFTVVLMDDIKIWAANINKPLYGEGEWHQ
jgi:hypothetical protein